MNQSALKTVRALSLDALRGIAILMMIMSGMEPFGGVLPPWMYHGQCPPPTHAFNPNCPGITWVDLVFPFFIFSMGAAIPFALSGKRRRGSSDFQLVISTVKRFCLLAFFAIAVNYVRPWAFKVDYPINWWFALIGFLLFFMAFGQFKNVIEDKINNLINIVGLILIAVIMYVFNVLGIIKFSLNSFDIIIMILACIALFGQIIWLMPGVWYKKYLVISAMMVCIFLSAKLENGYTAVLWSNVNIPPFITWEYIKYLIILIPGMIAGELMRKYKVNSTSEQIHKKSLVAIALLSVVLVISCLITLYMRYVELGLILSVLLVSIILFLTKKVSVEIPLLWNLLLWGGILVISGFILEPIQGGIKKDPATISYLIMTPGLAFVTLSALYIMIDLLQKKRGLGLIIGAGQNPMLAYLTGSNLVFALFMITGLNELFFQESYPMLGGVTKALVITLLAGWICKLSAQYKVFWKS